jgi:lysophospholipase L1-like esterase
MNTTTDPPRTRRSPAGAALRRARLLMLCAALGMVGAAGAQEPPHWVGTWAAAPQPPFPGTATHTTQQTLRLVVHTSLGGSRVRVRLSNLLGHAPLHIAAAHVARRTSGADVDPGSDRVLRFDGRTDVVVPPGQAVSSDAVALDVPALSDLAVSVFATGRADATTVHVLAQQTSYVARRHGDVTGAARFPAARPLDGWPFLAGVDVDAAADSAAVVVFGDSLVDGDGTTPDTNRRWPDDLAARLQHAGAPYAQLAVLNEGLIGNRLLYASPDRHAPHLPDFGATLGEAGLARFERDVLAQPGVKAVIVHLGTNDIGFDGGVGRPGEAATPDALVAGYRALIARAHGAGVRVIGSTLTPVEGVTVLPGYDSPAKDRVRQQVNEWIRHGGEFDGVIDFDEVLRDPDHPARLLPRLASPDHLHPDDAGYAELAAQVPLALFDGLAGHPASAGTH